MSMRTARTIVFSGVMAAAVVSCRFDPVASVAERDGTLPDASVDAARDALVDAQVDASDALVDVVEPDAGCSPDGFHRCNGDVLEVCQGGTWNEAESCVLGCNPDTRECRQVVASNGVDGVSPTGSPTDWVVSGTVTADSDFGTHSDQGVLQFGVVEQDSPCGGQPVSIGVFLVQNLVVQEGAELRIRGHNAVAIRALGRVEIHGVIRVSGGAEACIDDAVVRCAGPGGFWGGGRSNVGDAQDGDGPGGGGGGNTLGTNPTGGGGGGYLGTGGRGGNDTTAFLGADGGAGGAAYGSDDLQPLCGGSGGGSGALAVDSSSSEDHLYGGGGGGAIQITAGEGIEISCSLQGSCGIDAGGAGGEADHDHPYSSAAGGGGAGGAILLEAPTVQLDNAILSVAGGGGGGGYNSGAECVDGAQAPFSGERAAGGAGALSGGAGAGGQGGDGTNVGDNGADGDVGATGGGGGGAGRIAVRRANSGSFINGGILNPGQSVPGVLWVGGVSAE